MKSEFIKTLTGIKGRDSKGFVARARIVSTRVLAVSLFLLLLVTGSSWDNAGFTDSLFELLGFFLVGVSVFGRLWALMYISGYKESTLITDGPYSTVRNPLYFFSFVGTVGLGLAAESILITSVLVFLFVLYYPEVVLTEEKKLLARHGEKYAEYVRRTPRFIPRLSLLREPEVCIVNVKNYRKGFLDATVFVWIYGLLNLMEKMHDLGFLPTLFNIP